MSTPLSPKAKIDFVAVLQRGWQLFAPDAGKHIGFIVVVAYLPTLFIHADTWSVVMLALPILEGNHLYALSRTMGKEPKFSDAFLIFNRAVPLLLARWAYIALVALGTMLFIIPGIYLAHAWILFVPLILDRDLKVWQSLETSRRIITPQWFQLFILALVIGFINFGIGMITLGLSFLITVPLTTCIIVAVYESIVGVEGKLPYGDDRAEA